MNAKCAVRAAACSVALLAAQVALGTNGVWTNNGSSVWSTSTNWSGGNIANGAGSIADFSQLNITGATRTVTVDTTSRTVGTLYLGDADPTDNRSYTIAASGGATLTLDNGGNGASISQTATSNGDTISAPLVLADNLSLSNASTKTLTLSGGITSGATSGTQTITTTTGLVTINSIIGNGATGGTVALVQNGSGTLTLSSGNTFTGGLTVKSGTVIAGNNATALGGGSVTVGGGAPSGNANASLLFANSLTYANPITVQAGGTGTYTIGNSAGSVTLSGAVTLNNDVTISEINTGATGYNGGNYVNVSGAISGTGNITLAGNGAISLSNSGQPSAVNNLLLSNTVGTSGAITNAGTGTAIVAISGAIANTSGLTQNSATSMLSLTGANTYSGATNVNSGVLKVAAGSLSPNSAVTVASGATLQMVGTSGAASQTLTISGSGTSYSTGAIEASNAAAFVGNVALAADATISSDLATTTLTVGTAGTTAITGLGKNLTVAGSGNTTLAGSLNTGNGTLTKIGAGTLTISGASSFTGLTSINRGTLSLNISTALNGGGNITFGGGTLQYTANNSGDYASRIINSKAPISVDTNGQSRTWSTGLAASNTGGLTKIGSSTLTLSGTNYYSGITAVNGGLLAVSAAGALPSGSTVFTDVTGALNQGGAYSGVQGWLDSGKVSAESVGAIALTGASSENIDFTGFDNLMLGASTAANYTGTITPGSAGYRLGGGAGVISIASPNALTGAHDLVVGARSGNGSAGGGVTLAAANNLTGTTTVASSTLTMSSGSAGLTGSDVTVNRGATLAFSYAAGHVAGDNSVTRAKSVQLNGSTLSISGDTGGNTTETITGALTLASGQSLVSVSAATAKHELLSAGSFARGAGGTVLFTGSSLGVNANTATNVSSANIAFGTAPTLNGTGTAGGSASTSTVGILAGAYGDTTLAGSGFGTTGGLVTYDATNGIRLLNTGTEYKTAITSGQTQLDNIRYANTTSSAVTATLGADTSINSLSFASTGTGGVTIGGTNSLKINSGMIHSYQGAADAISISTTGGLDFNGQEAVILNQQVTNATFTISSVITNATGLTKSGTGLVILSGTSANTYSGTTTVNGGNLRLSKTTGLNAIPGDLVINGGATVSMGASDQIPDTANVTINGGTLILAPSGGNNGGVNETIHDLSMVNGATVSYGQSFGNPIFTVLGAASVSSGASLFQNAGGQLNITGLTSLRDGGTLTVKRSHSPFNVYDGIVTLGGGLAITNTASGAYTPVTINAGVNIAQNGGKLVLSGDVTFTGNSTNANTATIDAITGYGPRGVVALNGTRTFNIGNGAAANDLTVNAAMVDGSSAGALTKTGMGTLALTAASTFTGDTTVSAGKLVLGSSASLASSTISITAGATLDTTLQSLTLTGSQTYRFGVDGGGAGSAGLLQASALTIGSGKIDFATVGTLNDSAYVLARYTSLTGTFSPLNISNLPDNYTIDYDYGHTGDTIALVSIPEPATATMMLALGAGVVGLRRRRA